MVFLMVLLCREAELPPRWRPGFGCGNNRIQFTNIHMIHTVRSAYRRTNSKIPSLNAAGYCRGMRLITLLVCEIQRTSIHHTDLICIKLEQMFSKVKERRTEIHHLIAQSEIKKKFCTQSIPICIASLRLTVYVFLYSLIGHMQSPTFNLFLSSGWSGRLSPPGVPSSCTHH